MTDTSHFAGSQNGLRRHYRVFGPNESDALAVLCRPGLTRTSEGCAVLAAHLAAGDGAPTSWLRAPDRAGPGPRAAAERTVTLAAIAGFARRCDAASAAPQLSRRIEV